MAEVDQITRDITAVGCELTFDGEVSFGILPDGDDWAAQLAGAFIMGFDGIHRWHSRDWFVWMMGETIVRSYEDEARLAWLEAGGPASLEQARAETRERIREER